ncbi:MAG: protein phosphatase 2C domain-containing protein [Gemmataceae bacterium]
MGSHTAAGHAADGRQWSQNQDHLLVDLPLGLLMVLDGGGNWFGPEQRARRGAEVIEQVVHEGLATTPPQLLIENAFRVATETLLADLDEEGQPGGVAGVVLALIQYGQVHVSWLGDAMAHRVCGGKIEALTWSHSIPNVMLRNGTWTAEVAALRGERFANVLCHYLGGELPKPLEVVSFAPNPGDRLILTTDGVHDLLLGSHFVTACQTHPETQACAVRLIELAREHGSRDNCTCVVIAFE